MQVPLVDYPTLLELSFHHPFFGSFEILGFYRRHLNSQSLLKNIEISNKVEKIAFYFLEKYKHIIGNEKYKLLKNRMLISWKGKIANSYFISGKIYLINFDKKLANKMFTFGLKVKGWSKLIMIVKFKCFVGLLFSVFNIKIESLIKKIKREKYINYGN